MRELKKGMVLVLKEILDSECIPEDMYLQALKMTQGTRGTNIILERIY